MKAVFLKKYGKAETAFEIRETGKPKINTGQLLIKCEAFGLNFADVMARNGMYREAPPLPCVLGYECVGRVEEVADKENEHWLGKRVVAFSRFGAYTEYVCTDSRAVSEIDESTNVAEAAALATQYVTAYYSVYEQANIHEGNKILVHAAAGGVGTAVIQLAKLKNCEIFATTGSSSKFDYLKKQGASHIINYREEDYEKRINEIRGKEKLDASFNSIAGSTTRKDMRLLGAGGKLVIYGAAERSGKKFGILSTLAFVFRMRMIIPVLLMMQSKGVIGVNMLRIADHQPMVLKRCMENVIKLYREGKIKPVSGGEFSVTEIAKAHELLESRKSTGKIVVKW